MLGMKIIQLKSEYITLGQFLKVADCIQSGGEAKFFLQENTVFINGEQDQRRGRKLYSNDQVKVENYGLFRVQ